MFIRMKKQTEQNKISSNSYTITINFILLSSVNERHFVIQFWSFKAQIRGTECWGIRFSLVNVFNVLFVREQQKSSAKDVILHKSMLGLSLFMNNVTTIN